MNVIIHYLMKIGLRSVLLWFHPHPPTFGLQKYHFPAALAAFLENRRYSDSKAAYSLVTTNIK